MSTLGGLLPGIPLECHPPGPRAGKLKHVLNKHVGPVFALKWNRHGDLLLSGSLDKKIIVWDAKAGVARQTFDHHEGVRVLEAWPGMRVRLRLGWAGGVQAAPGA